MKLRRRLAILVLIPAALMLCIGSTQQGFSLSSSAGKTSPQKKGKATGQKPMSECGVPKITLKKIIDVEVEAEPASRKYGIDPALLLALFWRESTWDPEVRGCSREKGLGQFTPSTAQALGIKNFADISETSEKSAKQLAYLLNKYSKKSSDPVDLALAAWNVGETKVDTCSFTNKFNGVTYQGRKPCVPPDEWHTAGAGGKLTNTPTTYVETVKSYLPLTRKLVDYLATANDPAKAAVTARLRAELEAAVNQIAEKDQEITALNIKINDLNIEIGTLSSQLQAAPSGAVAKETEQRVKEVQLEYAQLQSKIDGLNQADSATANDATILRAELESANSELEALQQQLIEKDKIIADKIRQIEDQKASIAVLQREVDELRNSSNPDMRSAAQVTTLRDKIAAQNIKIKDLQDPLLQKELQNQLGSMTSELDLVCESFAECMSRGQRAYHSDDFSAAIAFFRQSAIISPESPLAWHWVGHAAMAAGRADEAFAAWDRILELHGAVPLTACEEVGQPRCEGGIIEISSDTMARYKGEEKVFEVPLSSVRVLNAANRRSNSHITFDLAINGVSHVFDFFPMGFNCPWQSSVTCPADGQSVQVRIGEYAAKTIQRLNGAGQPSPATTTSTPSVSANPQPPADSAPEAKSYIVQWILPSGTERVKIWPGSVVSNNVIIERLDGAVIKEASYADMVSLDINRRRVRIPAPGELLALGLPGGSSLKTYQLCMTLASQSKKLTYCFVSESAVCSVGEYCKEGSDGGASVQQLADDMKSHLSARR